MFPIHFFQFIFTHKTNQLSLIYFKICQIQKNQSSDWTKVYDPYYKAPYAYNKTIWVAYDDVKSLSCKVSTLQNNQLLRILF